MMNELNRLTTYQDLLLNLSLKNIEETLSQLSNFFFRNYKELNLFLDIMLEIILKKRNHRESLAILCASISLSQKNKKNPKEYKHLFLSKILSNEITDQETIHSQIHFIYLCMQKNFLTINDILNKFQDALNSDILKQYPIFVYYSLLYFSPYFKANDKMNYKKLCDQFEYMVNNVINFSKGLLRHWGHLPSRLLWINQWIIDNRSKIMDKESWLERETILKTGVINNSIEEIIQNDDVEKLQEKINYEIDGYKCNDRFHVFPEIIQNENVYMLQYAALFRSIKCFKFLILNKDLPDSFYADLDENIVFESIIGGNNEIIRILYQRKFNFNGALKIAFLFLNFDVFQWLFNMHNQKEIDQIMEIIKSESLISLSLDSLKYFMENGFSDKDDLKNSYLIKIINEKLHGYFK